MKKGKKVLVLALAMVVAASSLAGCAAKPSGETPTEGTKTEGTTGGGSKDQVIKLGQSADVTSFDPHKNNDIPSGTATRHIFNTLIKLTPDNKFEGDLAEKWEQVDNKTINFTLKPNVKFHNGEVLTSEDVKFSLERQKASAKVGHLVSMIDTIEVIDNLNFVLHLSEPSTAVISSLAHVGGSILCKKQVEELEASGKTLDEQPVGTGPYKFKSWKPGDSFELERYDEYFDEAGKAQNGGLLVKVIPEEATRTINLETGEIDLLIDVGAVDAQKIRDNPKLELVEFESTQIEALIFNTTKAPFDNKLVRQAINHVINRDNIIKVAMNGEAVPNSSYIGIAAIGYSDDVVKYDYDVEKAKALLTEAGYPNGFPCKAYLSGDTRSRSAQVVQAELAKIGITMTIEQMETATFYEKTGNGEHDICFTGWVANAEPDNTFSPLFSTETRGQGGNRAFYTNPTVDALIADGKVNLDEAKRMQDYADILKIVSEDAIWAPFYSKVGMVAQNAKLKGLVPYSILNHRYEGLHFEE